LRISTTWWGWEPSYEIVDAQSVTGIGACGWQAEGGGHFFHGLLAKHLIQPAARCDLMVEVVEVDFLVAQVRYAVNRRPARATLFSNALNKYINN